MGKLTSAQTRNKTRGVPPKSSPHLFTKEKKKLGRERGNHKLTKAAKMEAKRIRFVPVEIKCNGIVTTNRREWIRDKRISGVIRMRILFKIRVNLYQMYQ